MHKNCCSFPETLDSYHNEVVVTGCGASNETVPHRLGCLNAVTGCGSSNETVPHRLGCLNAWSLVGSTVWVDVGGVVLAEEVCHTGHVLRFKSHMPILSDLL